MYINFIIRKPPLCDICQEANANVYCKNDEIVLCFECDEEVFLI